MRLRFESYGCALNRGQARELEEAAAGAGYATGAAAADADIVVLVTCSVVQPTENRMLARLRALRESGMRAVVAGCMASARAGTVRRAFPEAVLLGPRDYAGFLALLARLCAVAGDFRLRAGMMNPESLLPRARALMAAMAHPKLFKFLHLPVQSGDDAVLEAMGRGHTAGDFERAAGAFREAFPLGVLATDIIVGFPGEDRAAFRGTLDLIGRARPDIVNIKAFSPRPGTRACRMKGAPGRAEVQRRIASLRRLRRRVSLANNRRLPGTVQEVLVTEMARKGGVMGRTDGYLPVMLDETVPAGSRFPVFIRGAGAGFLTATPSAVSKSNTRFSNKTL